MGIMEGMNKKTISKVMVEMGRKGGKKSKRKAGKRCESCGSFVGKDGKCKRCG